MRQNTTAKILLVLICAAFWANSASAQGDLPDRDINWRFIENADGTRTEFHRLGGEDRTLVKKTFTKNKVLTLITIYQLDRKQNPIGCTITDPRGKELFWVRYGYDKVTGLLLEEQMFDARVKHINELNGKEKPVMRFIYMHDALGNRQSPIALTLIPGKSAKEAFELGDTAGSALDDNPFRKDKKEK